MYSNNFFFTYSNPNRFESQSKWATNEPEKPVTWPDSSLSITVDGGNCINKYKIEINMKIRLN